VTKRIIQIALIIAAIGVIIYAYLNITSEKEKIGNPISLITPRSTLIMEISEINSMDDYLGILKAISESQNEIAGVSFNPTNEWYGVITKFDSLRSNNQDWFQALLNSPIFFCSNEQGRGDAWYFALGLSDKATRNATEMMKVWVSEKDSRVFKSTTIHDCRTMQWTILNQCLVVASEPSIIEDVILHSLASKANQGDKMLLEARNISSRDAPVHFYVSDDANQWFQLDPTWIDNQAVLSGYVVKDGPIKNNLNLAKYGATSKIHNFLPSNTSYLDSYSYSDFTSGWRLFEDYFEGTEKSKFWSQAWKDLGDSCACDLNASLLDWRSGEWGTAVITLSDSSTSEIAYYGITDSINVIASLNPVLDRSPDQSNGIYKIKFPQLFERNQPEGILIEHLHVMQKNGYLFAASTPGDLRALQSATGFLSEDVCYGQTAKTLNMSSGRFVFRKDFFATPLPQIIRQMLAGFSCLAMNSELTQDGKLLVNIALPFHKPGALTENTRQKSEPTITHQNTEAVQGPWVIINHKTGGKEQVFLNKSNELCLIGEDGITLWKKSIKSKILGTVQQIDALNNGKLQMAFTTESGFYVVDRNGNDLTGFPIQPDQPITSPLLVADYDNNKKYRFIFALENGAIQNLNTSGKTSDGWKNPSDPAIISSINHMRISNEDVLIAVSVLGKMNIYKRNGELKQSSEVVLTDYNGGNIQLQAGTNLKNSTIIYTDKSGNQKTSPII
jgi:hypothetical protein